MATSNDVIHLTIPARAEYIDIVRLTLYGIATRMGYSYEEIEDMKVAVSEACNNSVLYAYDDNSQANVEICFEISEVKLSISVKDHGRSFDFEAEMNAVEPSHEKPVSELQVGGLGIFMMQALMDDVQVRNDAGTEVVLTKLLHRGGHMT